MDVVEKQNNQFKNGKWCCSISCNSCSAKRSSGFKHLQKTKEKIGVKNKTHN